MQTNTTAPFQRFKNRIRAAIAAITPSQATLKAAGTGILAAMLLFFTLSLANTLLGSVGFGYFLTGLLCYALIALLLAWLLSQAIKLAAKTPGNFRTAVIFVIVLLLFLFRLSGLYGWIIVISTVIFPALIFGALYYRKAHRSTGWSKRQRAITWLSLGIGVTGIAVSLYFFLYAGTPVAQHIKNYKMLAPLPEQLHAADPSRPGSYKVAYLTYGSGTDERRPIYGKEAQLKTPAVDASYMLKSWDGLSGKLRTLYFGFDQTALPLNAMVWYPQNLQAPAPLVIVVHGNHLAQDWSEGGYDYLGKLLASRGYIVASIDENFLNTAFTDLPKAGLKNENGVRGWLMLKHLELWRKWNQDPHNPFYHHIDMDRIALIGHSRGGEAVSHAALFNTLPSFPDNANEVFNFNFHIKAYIAIAPVDGQYKPAEILAPLKDINYFVIQGTHDMDMQSYGGLSPYMRIKYSPSYNGFKAGLYVHHANHGQFNTSWGRYDGSSPFINQFNMTNLMPAHDQEQIAKVYISAFLDVNLKGDTVYRPLFEDYRYGRQWLPKQLYFNQYESSRAAFIARYEEDLDLQTATMPGVTISSEHLSVWREALHKLMWGDHISRAAYIGWNREKVDSLVGKYTFNLADSAALQPEGKSLVFSMAESNESSLHVQKGKSAKEEKKEEKQAEKEEKKEEKNPEEKKPLDFTVELTDSKGAHIRFLLSECMPLQPQIQKKLTKFAFLNQNDDAESIPDFFHFNLDTLQSKHPEFDMHRLRSIGFIFDQSKSGVIILDDVGFMAL
jgi:hypothetical protein